MACKMENHFNFRMKNSRNGKLPRNMEMYVDFHSLNSIIELLGRIQKNESNTMYLIVKYFV